MQTRYGCGILSETTDYLSGRFGLDGSLREARSTWTGNVSFSRAPTLQNDSTQTGTDLVLAYTNAAAVNGAYTYALTERWSLGATARSIRQPLRRRRGRRCVRCRTTTATNAGGNVGYAYSDRTQLTFAAVYSHISSDITRSDSVTTTLGVVHQFSPQLTISASVGGFWSDIEATQNASYARLRRSCAIRLAPRVPITTSDQRHDSGQLYGGNISYAFSERTQLGCSLVGKPAPERHRHHQQERHRCTPRSPTSSRTV